MGKLIFKTTLTGSATGPTGIVVPTATIEALDAGKKPAVSVDVNGYVYPSTVAVMGGKFMIPFSSAHRAATGLKAGDAITVTLVHDAAPRIYELPNDFDKALAKAGARAKFDAAAPSKRKNWVNLISEAKTDETRVKRIKKFVAEIVAGK